MTEFENNLVQSIMKGLQEVELKMAETIGEIRGDIKSLTEAVRASVAHDTKRLDKHSEELDDLRDRLIVLEGWQKNREKQHETESKKTSHRIAIWNTITIVVAVVLAYLFQKIG